MTLRAKPTMGEEYVKKQKIFQETIQIQNSKAVISDSINPDRFRQAEKLTVGLTGQGTLLKE